MRAAELQIERLAFPEETEPANGLLDPRAVLKQQVAERLAAHRSRRSPNTSLTGGTNLIAIAEPKPSKPRVNRIASAVAERYAQTPSYREFLAVEAARAVEAANAAAEIAARNAQAVSNAQQQLLAELDQWSETHFEETPTAFEAPANRRHRQPVNSVEASLLSQPAIDALLPDALFNDNVSRSTEPARAASVQHPIEGLTVRLYEDVGVRQQTVASATGASRAGQAKSRAGEEENDLHENDLLDDEIAFRQTPVFAEPAGPTVPIPANLIEFPRQLVAPRKARPRIAEGPLREELTAPAPASAQLRIFEVEPEQISTAPNAGVEVVVAEWSSIHLDAAPVLHQLEEQQELHTFLPLETASLNLRVMAATVDGCILGFTFLAAATAFALHATELPALPIAALATAAILLTLFILYQLLFFTFSDATPGMRYARIGLCTFSDENPTRAQMRRRTWAMLLSACPLGIGFLWALLDDDRLGWHDRICRMYQRGY